MSNDAVNTSAVSAARWSLIQGVAGTVLQFATLAALARLLEPAVFGAMAILFVVQGVATLFAQMGLSSALIQRRDLTQSAMDSLFWLNVALGIVVTLALIVVAPLVSKAFAMPELSATTRAIALTFVVSCWSVQYQALAQRQLRFRRMALINIASLIATAVVSVYLAWSGYGLWSMVAGVLAATLVRSFSFFVAGARDNGLPALHFDWQEARELVIFGAHRFGAMLANTINSYIDQLLVGGMLGAQPLGYYSIARRIVMQPVDLINPIVTRVAFPWLSRIQDQDDKLRETYLRILGMVTAVNAPLLVGAAVLAPWYVPLLLGDGWLSTIVLIQILAVYSLLRSVINAGASLILAKGRADWTFYWNLLLLVLYPVTLYSAAKLGDLRTMALSLAVLQSVVLMLYHRALIQPLTGIPATRFLGEVARPILTAGAAGAITIVSLRLLDHPGNWLNVILGAALGAVVYVALARYSMPQQVTAFRSIAFGRSGKIANP